MHRANYTTQTSQNHRQVKPEDEWVWTEVEPIISDELWAQCNKILDDRQGGERPGRRPVHLFSGLTYCHCGGKMYVRPDTPKYVCSKCRNKIPIVDLEAIFYEELKAFFLSPKEVANHLERADEHLAERKTLLGTLTKQQDELRQETERVYKLYVDGKIDGDGFSQFFKPLQERQRQLDDEVPRVQAEVDVLKINHLSADQVLSEANDLYARWPSLSRDEKQKIVESITDSIIIGKDEIGINLCHLGSSEEATKEQRKLTPAAATPAARPAAFSSSPASRRR
jgi:site-specific DNA recombinase